MWRLALLKCDLFFPFKAFKVVLYLDKIQIGDLIYNFALSGRYREAAAVAQREMKIISLYCLLVNLTSSFKKKGGERGCLDEMLSPDVFPVVDSRCNYSPAYSLRVGRCTG